MTTLDEIYNRLDRVELFHELHPQHKDGYLVLDCPACGHHEAFLYDRGTVLVCNRRNKCGYRVSIWDFVSDKHGLRNNREVFQMLARKAGITLEAAEQDFGRLDEVRRSVKLRDAVFAYARARLLTDAGKPDLEYLRSRRYTIEDIESMERGSYPTAGEIKAHLKEKGVAFTEADECLSPAFERHPVIGLWTDGHGEGIGLWGRFRGSPPEGERKFWLEAGMKKDIPFNLSSAQPFIRKGGTVIIVEGLFDARFLWVRGIKNVVAAVGSELTEAQLETLIRYGARRFLLDLDRDEAGLKGMEASIGRIHRHEGVRAFVIPRAECVDPEDYVLKYG